MYLFSNSSLKREKQTIRMFLFNKLSVVYVLPTLQDFFNLNMFHLTLIFQGEQVYHLLPRANQQTSVVIIKMEGFGVSSLYLCTKRMLCDIRHSRSFYFTLLLSLIFWLDHVCHFHIRGENKMTMSQCCHNLAYLAVIWAVASVYIILSVLVLVDNQNDTMVLQITAKMTLLMTIFPKCRIVRSLTGTNFWATFFCKFKKMWCNPSCLMRAH